MKVIDLLNEMSKFNSVPNKIKVLGKIFNYDEMEHFYEDKESKSDLLEIAKDYSTTEFLHEVVTVISEEKEINIQGIEEIKWRGSDEENLPFGVSLANDKINQLIKAIKQLDNKIKE